GIWSDIRGLRADLEQSSKPYDPMTYASIPGAGGAGNRQSRIGTMPGASDGFQCSALAQKPGGLVAPAAEAKIELIQQKINQQYSTFLMLADQADAAALQAAT